jgi:hypothetical protein
MNHQRDVSVFQSILRCIPTFWILGICVTFCLVSNGLGQTSRKKPTRVSPPNFTTNEFDGVFFADVSKQLIGEPPSKAAPSSAANAKAVVAGPSSETGVGVATNLWKERISGQSIEDLVKEAKRRLDSIVTTPSKFTAGGYKDARREFTLLAVLFAAVELYPEQVRWKNSAAVARGRLGRMAANAKVGTAPVFNEAKLRMDDLNTLLKGSPLNDPSPASELNWAEMVDRVPSMQILEWGLREQLAPKVASEAAFKENSEEILMYAELVSLIGETLHQPGMNDADDDEYKIWSKKMVSEALKIRDSVKLNNAAMAREASGQLDQSCNGCHNTFR